MSVIKPIVRTVRDFMLKIFNIFPLQEIAVFESNPDFNDEGYWLCKRFMDEKDFKDIKVYWILKDHDSKPIEGWRIGKIYNKPRNPVEWIKKYYILHTARYIFDSCEFVKKRRKGQFRLFLFHAMPLKRVDNYMAAVGDFDYFSAGGSFFAEYYRSLGIPYEKMIFYGLVRNDCLAEAGYDVRLLMGLPHDCKVVLWMPTYRQHATACDACNIDFKEGDDTGIPILKDQERLKKVNRKLAGCNMYIVLKLHQSQNLSLINVNEMSNLKVLNENILQKNQVQLYSVIRSTDALITDYSSIYLDYLLLDKPIGLTIDDLVEYQNRVGFVFGDYKKHVKGFYINDVEDLLVFFEKLAADPESLNEMHSGSKETFHDVLDFSSGNNVLSFIKTKIVG